MENFKRKLFEGAVHKESGRKYSTANNRKLIMIGTGETGYFIQHFVPQLAPEVRRTDMCTVSNEPVHRLRLASLLFATGFYERLNFERPMLAVDKTFDFCFEDVVSVDPELGRLEFFGGSELLYDYLILACGRQRDPRSSKLCRWAVKDSSPIFDSESSDSLERLNETFESLHSGMTFDFLVMKDSRAGEVLSMAFIFREYFPGAEINLFLEDDHLFYPSLDTSIEAHLVKARINLIKEARVEEDDQLGLVSLEGRVSQFLFFSPSRIVPEFLGPDLAPASFDPSTLRHSKLSNVFAAGSFLDVNCGIRAKYSQSVTLSSNLDQQIKQDWFDQEPSFLSVEKEHSDAFLLGKRKVGLVRGGELVPAGLWNSWKFLNRDIFRYFHRLTKSTKFKGLFI